MSAAGERDAVERLIQLVSAEGFRAEASHELDEALRLVTAIRLTPQEGRAIDLLLALHAARKLPDALLVPVAAALVDRGEPAAAARALAGSTSPAALMLRADLLAQDGRLGEAADVVETVLLRDLDWPGARERHARWRREAATVADGAAPAAPPTRPSPGRHDESRPRAIGGAPFRLLREIARGGTGAVYEAEDGDLGRRVALKVYHQPERDRSQLAHEARVAVSLAGPGVVRVFDVDVDAGWLAMQWAPLGALGVLLRSGEGRLLGVMGVWASCLARALARVHAAGWVHHDIKPANVLVEAPGRVILTDFAAARRRGEAGPPGSRGYVSPERAAGRASDPRDDVFGYGRTVEDVLAALDRARAVPAPGVVSAWRELALACTGPDAQRPVDGAALVERIDAIAAR